MMGQAAATQRMMALAFNPPDARHYWNLFWSQLKAERARWPWLWQLCEHDPAFRYDILNVAASELIRLAVVNPDLDPLERSDTTGTGVSLLIRAWAYATSWAWNLGEIDGTTHQPRTTTTDPLFFDGLEDADPNEDTALPVDLTGLTDRQAELLAYSASGCTWQELSLMDGAKARTLATGFRRAVRRLLADNPHLQARFGLVECPDHWGDHWCGVCRLFGFVFGDGRTITEGR